MCSLDDIQREIAEMATKLDQYHADATRRHEDSVLRHNLAAADRAEIKAHIATFRTESQIKELIAQEINASIGTAVTDWFQAEWKPYGRLIKFIAVSIPFVSGIFGLMAVLGWI